MSGVWGEALKISIFGESHGEAIGIVIDGLPAGFEPDMQAVHSEMARRAPGTDELSTPRKEADEPQIVSGLLDGKTTGTPLCCLIRNTNTKSGDYEQLRRTVRPGHSDYGYFVKTQGNNDVRGGGHSSGRLTAPLVFCGALCKQLLAARGIEIGAHLYSLDGVKDRAFGTVESARRLAELRGMRMPLLDPNVEAQMRERVALARRDGDSVGGVVECMVVGVPAGVGEPFFQSVESQLSALLFSVPAVKGVEFGDGFALAQMRGSQANDPWIVEDGEIRTLTNRNGGVLGGIATSMPIVFRVAIKPTPSIFVPQRSVDPIDRRETTLQLHGRHDPCIAVRAVPVIEAAAAIAIYDLIARGERG